MGKERCALVVVWADFHPLASQRVVTICTEALPKLINRIVGSAAVPCAETSAPIGVERQRLTY